MRCSSHNLHLLETGDIDKVLETNAKLKDIHDQTMKRCAALWALTKSPKNNEIIFEILNEELKRPVPTRWNSTYKALSQIFKLRVKIGVLEARLGLDPLKDCHY